MKKFLTVFFVVLGVVFFVFILFAIYFFIADPLNLKPLFMGSPAAEVGATEVDSTGSTTEVDMTSEKSVLSPKQEAALESFGIDPAKIPSTISPDQEACFEAVLGASRVAEIKAGATPTAADFFAARGCVE